MAIVIRCEYCEKDHEINEKELHKSHIDCPFCNNMTPVDKCSAIMFCPHCYAELHVPVNVINRELQCPYCDKTFHSNLSFSLSGNDDTEEEKILEEHKTTVLSEGDIFDKYKIIRMLGKGGMGEVYLVQHMLLNNILALKILNPNAAAANQVYAKRFIREAKLANRISSEHFAAVYDAGLDVKSNSLFIAMEYIDGDNFNDIINSNGPLNEVDILKIALSVTDVLIIFEQENIVHRDIKPSNIMINSDGLVKLTDLGIAKSESQEECELTLTQGSMVFGTPNFASPEQCRSSHNVDFRSDIYSLGATMFYMAAGIPPYEGSTAMEVVLKVINEEPKDLGTLTKDFSAGFVLLVNDMLKHDPDKRPPNARALKMRIEHLLKGHQSWKVRLKYGSRIFYSQLQLFFFNAGKVLKKVIKKFPKRAFKSLIKKLVILFLIFAAIVIALRNRHVAVDFYKNCSSALQKFINPKKKVINTAEETPSDKASAPEKTVTEKKTEDKKIVDAKPIVAEKKETVKKRKKTVRRRKKIVEEVVPKKKTDDRFYHDALRKAIFARLEKCNHELRILRKSASKYNRSWYYDRVEFYEKLRKNLFKQLTNRERAFSIKSGKGFNVDISESIAVMVHEYSKKEHKSPYSPEEKAFAQRLLYYIKKTESNPNVRIRDYKHPKFSGPLLRWVEHANIPMKKEIISELMLHHVSADCISEKCSIELCKYGIISMKGLLSANLRSKKYDNVITLIDYGADVNEVDESGRTPLHWAILYDNLKIARYLLMAGANINAADGKEFQTPLFYAEKYASAELKELLISLGADGTLQDKHGNLYQHYLFVNEFNRALQKGDLNDISSLLDSHPELSNMEITGGMTPLQFCCKEGNASAVMALLKNKAEVDAVSYACPYTPLQLAYEYPEQRKKSDAIRLSRWGIFTSLLQHGANAAVPPIGYNYPTLLQFSLSDFKNADKHHMFYVASIIRNSDTTPEIAELLKMLYKHDEAYYRNDKDGEKRKRIFSMLLLKRPDLSHKKFAGLFPAVAWSPKITEEELDKLLQCKADINGKDKYGRNALYVLCSYIVKNKSYLDSASMNLLIQRIKYLLKNGVDKNCKVSNISIQDMELPEAIRMIMQ